MRMKKVIASTFVLLLSGMLLHVQAQEDVIKSLKAGFKSGSVYEISNYLSPRTEIAFEGDKEIFQKDKAEQILKDFFTQNKPKDFQVLHQGASKEGLKFYIGELLSSSGTYRVLVYLRTKGDKSLIETIDISKE